MSNNNKTTENAATEFKLVQGGKCKKRRDVISAKRYSQTGEQQNTVFNLITSTSFPWLREKGLEETAASHMSFLANPYDGFNVQANSIVDAS